MLARGAVMQRRILAGTSFAEPGTPVLSFILITPPTFSLAEAETVQLTATGYDQFGNVMAGLTFSWASSASGVASVNSSTGLVTGVAAGDATITASTSGGLASAPANCSVTAGVVASIGATPASLSIQVGGATGSVTADPKDAAGHSLAGRTLNAVSSDTGTATVSISGYAVTVTAVAEGACTVTITEPVSGANVVVGVDVAAAATTHEPTDVTMTTRVNTGWASETLDTPWVNPSSHGGLSWTNSANRMTVRRTSDQSWRDAGVAAIPATPSGDDHMLVCRFQGTETQGYKGLGSLSLSGIATVYIRSRVLINDVWSGHPSGAFKYFDLFFSGTGAGGGNCCVPSLRGSGSGGITTAPVLQGTNKDGNYTSGIPALTRNTWREVEWLIVAASASGAADGHVTVWNDGSLVQQVSGIQWRTTGGTAMTLLEMLHYYGGTGAGSSSNYNYVCTDELYISTSTSRAAMP